MQSLAHLHVHRRHGGRPRQRLRLGRNRLLRARLRVRLRWRDRHLIRNGSSGLCCVCDCFGERGGDRRSDGLLVRRLPLLLLMAAMLAEVACF